MKKQTSAIISMWADFFTKGSFLSRRGTAVVTAPLFSLLLAAGMAMPLPARAAGGKGVSAISFSQNCRELSERKEGDKAQSASLIIRSWVQGMHAQASINADCGGQNGALVTMFPNAEDPAWCAASIEKFLADNKKSLPDDLTAAEALPLWWLSVHPNAGERHKELLRARLQALQARKRAMSPPRRFSVVGG